MLRALCVFVGLVAVGGIANAAAAPRPPAPYLPCQCDCVTADAHGSFRTAANGYSCSTLNGRLCLIKGPSGQTEVGDMRSCTGPNLTAPSGTLKLKP
jgi:hypothetical protein